MILEEEGIATYNTHKPTKSCPEWNEQDNGEWNILNLVAIHDEHTIEWKHPKDPRKIGEALWPERYPVEFLRQFQKRPYEWNSQYMGLPIGKEGNIIKSDWIKQYTGELSIYTKYVRFWDFGGTPKEKKKQSDPDFTAGVLIGLFEGNFYIIDVVCLRDTPKKVKEFFLNTAKKDHATYSEVTQFWEKEPGASASHLEEELLQMLSFTKRQSFKTNKSKEYYVDFLADKAETGNVYYIKNSWYYERHDNKTFFEEMKAFPKVNHDDRIDAAAKALFVLAQRSGQSNVIEAYPLIVEEGYA